MYIYIYIYIYNIYIYIYIYKYIYIYIYICQCCTQSFFGYTGACTGTETLMKVLESAPSDRQTDRQTLWLYLAAFQCQTTKQNYKIMR